MYWSWASPDRGEVPDCDTATSDKLPQFGTRSASRRQAFALTRAG